jgi:hypothetical protein
VVFVTGEDLVGRAHPGNERLLGVGSDNVAGRKIEEYEHPNEVIRKLNAPVDEWFNCRFQKAAVERRFKIA